MMSFKNIFFGAPFNKSNKKQMSLLDTIGVRKEGLGRSYKKLRFSIIFELRNPTTVHPFTYIQISAVHSHRSI